MLKVLEFSFLLAFIMNAAKAAEIISVNKSETLLVGLTGTIVKGDARKLGEILATTKNISKELFVTSRGGDVIEAMKIGEILRAENISVTIPAAGLCYSSCVLILAAGNLKTVDGDVGIHRPYLVNINASTSIIDNEYPKVLKKIKEYFDLNGINPSLAEDMFSINPENIKILTKDEISRYRLDQQNYINAEKSDIWWSRKLGISRYEFLARKKRVDDECIKYRGDDERMKMCFDGIIYKSR